MASVVAKRNVNRRIEVHIEASRTGLLAYARMCRPIKPSGGEQIQKRLFEDTDFSYFLNQAVVYMPRNQ